ncbi:TIGR00269 family protein [Candidatus Woesearchaeota archaeon]|jgi:uncharacterized protein (TIGR00269 family)|nr:TIGR00269 family protein [Candidatus Woesearchaeota archaeon]MBT3538062.1 TIGR00269 family protein [Candidatus Woesearchaeota archaeon]MBT4697146.1 TIGR00269 family protein [Candidatus Woesearchaeota archaeon]MBT4717137.1 TIGR00269 family protein [Candidatus Woesearchaeota archaeon]MBT7105731.1 TIGR00269 family protein [Candidatus Woesearchaeota archaeon]
MNASDAKFLEKVESKVQDSIKKYSLFAKKDLVGVAVSGGKDSTVCLHILKKLGYKVEALTIDAAIGNYTKVNLDNLIQVCDDLKVKLHIVSFRDEFGKSLCYMRSILNEKGYKYSSCMLCGILKRYLINKYSKKYKFNYLTTGHNLDDEAQAFIMNLVRGDMNLAFKKGPKTGSSNAKGFVQRVKPLYDISEKEIIRYSKIMKFPVNYEICPCSTNAYRRGFLNILNDLEEKQKNVKQNIVDFHQWVMSHDKRTETVNIPSCKLCGEPTSGEICRTCTIFQEINV